MGVKIKAYFAGANSERGFVNFFDSAVEGVERLYVLKGSPGCGKSGFIKRIAAAAEERGEWAERIFCASDPESLDGVVLRERSVAVLDGTAPHLAELRYPGVRDRLINLGEFWDREKLLPHREKAVYLSEKKKKCFAAAYRMLKAAGELRNEGETLTEDALLSRKLATYAKRVISANSQVGAGFRVAVRLNTAFCAEGFRKTELCEARKRYVIPRINDSHDFADRILRALLLEARERGLEVTVSLDPLSPRRINALLLNESGVLFEIGGTEECDKRINPERFVDRALLGEVRGRERFALRCRKLLTEGAAKQLARAREAHFELEGIYVPAMDFEAVNRCAENTVREIFG